MTVKDRPGALRLRELEGERRNGHVIHQILGQAISEPLARLDEACRLLSECTDLAEIRAVHDMAEAARLYARAANRGLEAQNNAAEIKIRAERRAGELLAELPKNGGARGVGVSFHDGSAPTLTELGIDTHDSHRWQQVARVPATAFEAHIEQVRTAGRELTSASVRALAPRFTPKRNEVPQQPLLRFCPADMPTATIVTLIMRVFYPDADNALDMTYGNGAFWDGSAHVTVTALDVDPTRARDGVADSCNLSYADNTFDVTLFDPPHVADAGGGSVIGERFGTYANGQIQDVIRAGAYEALRVGRLGCVVKVTDHVHAQTFVRETGWVIAELGEPFDVVHQTRARAFVDPKWGEQLSAYNNGSTYLIFRKDGPTHVRREVGA